MDRKTIYVVGAVIFLAGLFALRLVSMRQNERVSLPAQAEPTYAPVYSDEQFATQESIDSTIKAESDQIDKDLKAINDSDFDASGLTQNQLEQ